MLIRLSLASGDMTNQAFEEYYKTQGIVPEGEWNAFIEILKKPLPITFRINGSGSFANDLREKLECDFFANFNQGPIMVGGNHVPQLSVVLHPYILDCLMFLYRLFVVLLLLAQHWSTAPASATYLGS